MVSESLKRRLSSESDSEREDQCGSPLSHNSIGSGDSGCFTSARKKRRGLIEKRRRDRINRSLNDLKNLVPTAHERQVSAKLEKSEILSLAVDHIKSLTSKVESANPHTLAMDYRSIGYRECMSEMIGYLIHGEGMGPGDALHNRLVSHLHQQLSGYSQVPSTTQQRYHLPTDIAPNMYNSNPNVQYDTVAVCKPEPPTSPSYNCGAATTPDYNNYHPFAAGYERSNTANSYQWPSQTAIVAVQPPSSSCSNQSADSYAFQPPSAWV